VARRATRNQPCGTAADDMTPIDSNGRMASLWVDENGALLVDEGADAPLPPGAAPAKYLPVNDDGELILSTS